VIQQCWKTLTIYSSPKLRVCDNEPYTALMGVRRMQVKFCWVIHCESRHPKEWKQSWFFRKYIVELAPDCVLLIVAALNLQVLFHIKAFSIHLAPTTHINNPCNLFNWVPLYCVQIAVEDSGLLEYDVLSISKKFLMFQKITMPSSSGSMHCM